MRYEWLDRIKGLGILLVMTGHVYTTDSPAVRLIRGMNVSLFFLASGFLQCMKEDSRGQLSSGELVKKKTRGILKPYLFYSGIVMVWQLIRLAVFGYGSSYELIHCVVDIFCLEGISSLWFLAVLYLGELICILFDRKMPKWAECLLLFAGTWALLGVLPLLDQAVSSGYQVSVFKLLRKFLRIAVRALAAACFMSLGGWLCELWKKRGNIRHDFGVPAAAAILCGLAAAEGMEYNGITDFHYLAFGNLPVYFVSSVLAFVFAWYVAERMKKDVLLSWIGRNSLFFMATHLIILDFIQICAALITARTGYPFTEMLFGKYILMMVLSFGVLKIICAARQSGRQI